MILEVYITIFAIALALIIIGYAAERPHAYATGYIFLFLLGVSLMDIGVPYISGGVEYKTGMNLTDTGTTTSISYSYATFSNFVLGFFTAITSIWLFILTLLQTGGKIRR